MADRDRNQDQEQRWDSTPNNPDWTDRADQEHPEGDRSMARNYNRQDQRRYASRGQDLGDRLRQLRGQDPDEGMRGNWRETEQRYENRNRQGDQDYRQGNNWDRDAERNRYRNRDQGLDRDPGEGDPNRGYMIDYSGNFGREDRDQEAGSGGDVYRGFEMPQPDQRSQRDRDRGRGPQNSRRPQNSRGAQSYRGPQDYRQGQSTGRGSRWETGSRDERERYRGYGTEIARNTRDRSKENEGDRDWGWRGQRDEENDYRTYNRGRDLNLEGAQGRDLEDRDQGRGFDRGLRQSFDPGQGLWDDQDWDDQPDRLNQGFEPNRNSNRREENRERGQNRGPDRDFNRGEEHHDQGRGRGLSRIFNRIRDNVRGRHSERGDRDFGQREGSREQGRGPDRDFNRREDYLNRERGDRGDRPNRSDRSDRWDRGDQGMERQRYQDIGNSNMYGPGYVDRGPVSDSDRRGDFDRDHLDFDYEVEEGYRNAMDRDWRASDEDLTGNYWGARERERRNRDNQRGGERDRQGDQGGFISGRSTTYGGRNDPMGGDAFDDDREFDMDPGFAYEFGTDFDFMRDTDRETNRRNYFEQHQQGQTNRGEAEQRGNRGREENRGEAQRRTSGGQGSQGFRGSAGPHSGKGPSGYQRPDNRIMEDVCERLTQHGQIDSRNVEIQVDNGEVKLSGTVRNKNEKRLAEDVAEGVTGVKNVENNIKVSTM